MTQPIAALEKPPSPGAPHRADLPAAVERTLANGMRVIVFPQRSAPKAYAVPLIAAQLIVRGGASAESEAEAGLATLTTSLLTHGTANRSSVEIAQSIDGLGARLDAASGYDASIVSLTALTHVFPNAFALFDEIARHPSFPPDEVERVRAKAIGDLALSYSSPNALARFVAQRVAFAGAPYGHPVAGTAETLATLDRERVVAFHARYFRPDNVTLIIGGDCIPEEAFALAEQQFGDWRAPAALLPVAAPFTPPAPRSRVVIVDKPDAGRTAIVVGRIGIARRAPEYAAGVVATAVLSGYSGRLNQEVRVKRGLSYGAGAQLIARREPGLFLSSTLVDHTKVDEAVAVVLDTLRGLAAAPPEATELVTRKATISGGFSRSIETIDGIAGVLGELALYDVPLTELGDYLPEIEAVDPAMVQRFAAAAFDDLFVVLVGDARVFGEAIALRHPNVTTIPLAQLDLGQPGAIRR
ncbi:MAG TPA: pitrilysin family protein [Candidatus Lustribacter sp.]